MDERKLRLTDKAYSLPASDADKLIAAGSGDCALLYIYLLRQGGSPRTADAARDLRMTEARASAAADALRAMGLMDGAPSRPLPSQNETPEYSAEDIVRRTQQDPGFAGLVAEAQRALGRVLSSPDLKMLFGIYDYAGLPADVIMELLHYCCEEYREKYGPGRVPSMRYIEKEAYSWANREIMTFEQAEEHIKLRRERRDTAEKLKRAFGIRDRDLTATERKYIDDWLAMGFPAESIEIAYDRTVTNTGSLKWAYMNKIILSWDSKRLHTPKEIEKGDGKGGRETASVVLPQESGSNLERLNKLYEKVRNGR